MILFLHNRYRTEGGEERAVADLMWLVREHLGEAVDLLERRSAGAGASRAAAGLLAGGLDQGHVAQAVRRSGARVVHAHNLHPTLGWRALQAARAAGARTVLHLHNYRLVCAVGTCFTEGADCTRCHGRDTLPGLRRRCRGSVAEGLVYAAGLAAQQRRIVEHADVVVVPSAAARDRLLELGAPLAGKEVHVVGHVVRAVVQRSAAAQGTYALVAGRLAPEKGVDVAIAACAAAGIELVVAGDGPESERLRARARGTATRFVGRVPGEELDRLRAGAALAIVPSQSAETFGLAAAEAMAAGLPVVGSAIGALPELCGAENLATPGDAAALAVLARARFGDGAAGEAARRRVQAVASPGVVAPLLRAAYG